MKKKNTIEFHGEISKETHKGTFGRTSREIPGGTSKIVNGKCMNILKELCSGKTSKISGKVMEEFSNNFSRILSENSCPMLVRILRRIVIGASGKILGEWRGVIGGIPIETHGTAYTAGRISVGIPEVIHIRTTGRIRGETLS